MVDCSDFVGTAVVPSINAWLPSTWISAIPCDSIHRIITASPFSGCRSSPRPVTCSTWSVPLPSNLPTRPSKENYGSCNEGASGNIVRNRKLNDRSNARKCEVQIRFHDDSGTLPIHVPLMARLETQSVSCTRLLPVHTFTVQNVRFSDRSGNSLQS